MNAMTTPLSIGIRGQALFGPERQTACPSFGDFRLSSAVAAVPVAQLFDSARFCPAIQFRSGKSRTSQPQGTTRDMHCSARQGKKACPSFRDFWIWSAVAAIQVAQLFDAARICNEIHFPAFGREQMSRARGASLTGKRHLQPAAKPQFRNPAPDSSSRSSPVCIASSLLFSRPSRESSDSRPVLRPVDPEFRRSRWGLGLLQSRDRFPRVISVADSRSRSDSP